MELKESEAGGNMQSNCVCGTQTTTLHSHFNKYRSRTRLKLISMYSLTVLPWIVTWIFILPVDSTHFRGGHIWFTPTGEYSNREVGANSTLLYLPGYLINVYMKYPTYTS